jgi:hypothetical protein
MVFQEYGKQQEKDFSGSQKDLHIQNQLVQSFGVFRLMGRLVEVYLPKMFEVAIELTKGGSADESPRSKADPRVK